MTSAWQIRLVWAHKCSQRQLKEESSEHDQEDDYLDKALEGFAMFALNQGEVCTCPSRALVDTRIYDRFVPDGVKRVEAIKRQASTPVAVGFGIRDAASAQAIGAFADAVVIGSALVERLAGAATESEVCARARDFLAPIRAALDARK